MTTLSSKQRFIQWHVSKHWNWIQFLLHNLFHLSKLSSCLLSILLLFTLITAFIIKYLLLVLLSLVTAIVMSNNIQYIPRNMHTVTPLLCFVVVIHWLIFPYPPGLLHWHCGNLTIAPVPAKQPWWIWINISCEFIMNDCITTTKPSTTKPCAYFLGYTVCT